MAQTYVPVTFNEGAPLDPQQLMKLQSNITSLVGDVNGLKNATADASYTMLTDGGYFETEDLKAGTAYEYEVPYSSAFDESSPPRIIATVSSVLSGEIITLSVKSSSTKPTIQVWTNKARKGIWINWMAFQKK
jgi:hypothetical protein